jgi:hypothetical protein
MSNAVLRAIPVMGQRAGPISRNARSPLAANYLTGERAQEPVSSGEDKGAE